MKIAIIIGTRPEAIKLLPLARHMRTRGLEVKVCITGQHSDLLTEIIPVFDTVVDDSFALERNTGSLSELTAKMLIRFESYFSMDRPDLVIVQGDTTSVLTGTLAAFYQHIPVAHVEAGLRSGNLYSPWPEEANRILTGHLASIHFCPTQNARNNLLKEGIPDDKICVTGNTVIDALLYARDKSLKNPPRVDGLPDSLQPSSRTPDEYILVTCHRRENIGKGIGNICLAILTLARRYPHLHWVLPVHANPAVQTTLYQYLDHQDKIHLIRAQSYLSFIALMDHARFILSDSGGVQEEAPSLGKPVLVLRDTTERPEAIQAGTALLAGVETQRIIELSSKLMDDPAFYAKMSHAANPYGDGTACRQITDYLLQWGHGNTSGMLPMFWDQEKR